MHIILSAEKKSLRDPSNNYARVVGFVCANNYARVVVGGCKVLKRTACPTNTRA
jgi:hypothetical protein